MLCRVRNSTVGLLLALAALPARAGDLPLPAPVRPVSSSAVLPGIGPGLGQAGQQQPRIEVSPPAVGLAVEAVPKVNLPGTAAAALPSPSAVVPAAPL
jgi:hypothetical protein